MMVRIVVVYPDLLGTYGDRGNALVLAAAVRRAGHEAEVIDASSDRPLPRDGALYLLGGGEDGPQVLAARLLARDGTLRAVVDEGRPVLAVCAGLQLLGRSFAAEGAEHEGLGILPVRSASGERRAVGEVLTSPVISVGAYLTGFENHRGVTTLEGDAVPLGRVLVGVGNGVGGVDGVVAGSVVGTYLHGPVLARNPYLAAWLLERARVPRVEPSTAWRELADARIRAALQSLASG